MANQIVTLNDNSGNNLYPSTLYNAVTDANGVTLPSDFTDLGGSDLPTTTTAGKVLKSTSTSGTVEWGDPIPTTSTAGKVLKSTSTAGTVEWGTVSSQSTDVQINGTSITSNNVANIVTNTAYNSSSNKIATMSDIPSSSNFVKTSNNGTQTITTSSGDSALKLKSASTASYLGLTNSNNVTSYFGVNSSRKPVFYDTSDHRLAYTTDIPTFTYDSTTQTLTITTQ